MAKAKLQYKGEFLNHLAFSSLPTFKEWIIELFGLEKASKTIKSNH